MKRLLASLPVFGLLLAAVAKEHPSYCSARWYDTQTNIAFRWLNDRDSVVARVRDNHTSEDDGAVNEPAIETNLSEIARLVHCVIDMKTCD